MKTLSRLSALGFVTAAIATGCGGIGAGDYVVYRVAFTEGAVSGDCADPNDDGSSNLRDAGTMVIYGAGDADELYLDLGNLVLTGAATDEGYDFSGQTVDTQDFGGQDIFDSDHDGLDDFNNDPLVDSDNDGLDESNGDDMDVDVDMDGLDDLFEDDIVDADNDGEDDRYVTIGGVTAVETHAYKVTIVVDGENVSGTHVETSSITCEGTCTGFTPETCSSTSTFVGVEIDDTAVNPE